MADSGVTESVQDTESASVVPESGSGVTETGKDTESEATESESGWRVIPIAALELGPEFEDEVRVVYVSGTEREIAETFLDHGPQTAKLAGQRAGYSTDYCVIICRSMHLRGALMPRRGPKRGYELTPGCRKYLEDKRKVEEERERKREEERKKLKGWPEWPFE